MSAFIVSKSHIDALVNVAVYGPRDAEGQWHGPSWSRECEPYEAVPGYPQSMTDQRWMRIATGGLEQLRKAGEVTGDELGFVLWAENVASVHHRYPGEDVDTLPGTYCDGKSEVSNGYTFERFGFGRNLTCVEALKAIACLDYQSCEHPEWRESEAFRILESLKDSVISVLPGYNAASWTVEAVSA